LAEGGCFCSWFSVGLKGISDSPEYFGRRHFISLKSNHWLSIATIIFFARGLLGKSASIALTRAALSQKWLKVVFLDV